MVEITVNVDPYELWKGFPEDIKDNLADEQDTDTKVELEFANQSIRELNGVLENAMSMHSDDVERYLNPKYSSVEQCQNAYNRAMGRD